MNLRRPRKSAVMIQSNGDGTQRQRKWTNKEKRSLVQALIHCHPSDIGGLAQYLPTRSKREIETRIQSYKPKSPITESSQDKECGPDMNVRVSNIELWSILTRKMVAPMEVDLSYHMAEVLNVIASTEDMELPADQSAALRNIYLYLSELLSGMTPSTRLSRVEGSLMQDCLSSLQETFKGIKQTGPRDPITALNEYMKWKYAVFDTQAGGSARHDDAKIQIALNNEWAGFSKNNMKRLQPLPCPADPTMANSKDDAGAFTPGQLYTLNPFCIPNNLLQLGTTSTNTDRKDQPLSKVLGVASGSQ